MKKPVTNIIPFTQRKTISVWTNRKIRKKSKSATRITISIIIALITITAVIITATNTAASQNDISIKEQYKDITGHWSREYVHKLTQMGIVSGYGDGRFGPDDTLKVDEFIKMTLRAMGYKVEEGTKYWAEPYIELAKKVEIIDENEFTDYRRPILREEAARIIVKAALKEEEAPIPNHVSYVRRKLPDYNNIGDEYKQYVIYSYALGIFNGVADGSFLPKKTLTRGEGSAIILRYLDKGIRNPTRPKDSEILVVSNTYDGITYEIYPPSKQEVMNVARLMQKNMSKSKGFASIGYNPAYETIYFDFYENKDSYEESSVFTDCGLILRMAEWNLDYYYITVYSTENTKKLHIDVFYELFEYLFGKEAEKVKKDFNEYLELVEESSKLERKIYKVNNREVIFIKPENGNSVGLSIQILG